MNARTIRNLSLITILLSGLWFLSTPDYEPAIVFITALVAVLATNQVSEGSLRSTEASPLIGIENAVTPEIHVSYSEAVGSRLKWLREQILELSLREMAEFLNINIISTLELYESGEKEYPLHLIKKIEEFFRISQKYIESGEGAIFLEFTLSQESVNSFLDAGYTPILACRPSERGDLFCYQVFKKVTNSYTQLAFADRYGSFSSSGGGKTNIGYLINALLDRGLTPSAVRILKANQEEWNAISNGSCYSINPFSRLGSSDWECMDIFDTWFDEYAKCRAKWYAKS